MACSHRGCPNREYWVHLGPARYSGSLLKPGNKSLSPSPREGGGAAFFQERGNPCPVMSRTSGPCWDLLVAASCPAGSGAFWKETVGLASAVGGWVQGFLLRTSGSWFCAAVMDLQSLLAAECDGWERRQGLARLPLNDVTLSFCTGEATHPSCPSARPWPH